MRTMRYGIISLLAIASATGCDVCQIGFHSANLIECMPDNPDMPPMGEVPYIDKIGGISPIIPIGIQTIGIKGGRFDLDRPGLVVEIRITTPNIIIKTTATIVDEKTLTVKPTWPSGLTGGAATIVVSNSKGTSSQPLGLIRYGVTAGSSASVPQLAATQWLNFGQSGGISHLYALDSSRIIDTPYMNGTLGSPAALVNITAAAQAASADLDNDGLTDFAITDNVSPGQVYSCLGSMSFTQANAGLFGSAWNPNRLAAVGAGSYDAARSMITVASQGSAQLFSCITPKSPYAAMACMPVGSLAATASALWVSSFGALHADILSLDLNGKLTIWRSDGADKFSDQTSQALGATVQAKSFLAVAVGDVDGKPGDDIVAVNGQGVTTLVNNGAGKFTATETAISSIPQAKAITLGDVDGDGKADIVLTAATTGAIWVLRNQIDAGGNVSWLISGPVLDQTDMQLAVGSKGVAILDGVPGVLKRRLVTTDIVGQKLIVWTNNTTQ